MVGIVVRGNLTEGHAEAVRRAGAAAGSVRLGGREYPRLQVLTEAQVLGGRKFQTPEPMRRGPARREQVELQREEMAAKLRRTA